MNDNNFTIRTLAKNAKNRLKDGYWTEVKEIRDSKPQQNSPKKYYNHILTTIISKQQEEEYYHKVCEIMDSESGILNPLGRLIDNEYYASLMDLGARQRYILGLAELFLLLKQRYLRERQL